MLPSRCPHCQAELPKLGRFCVMCGRRVEGWRGLMAVGDLDLDPGDAEASPGGGRNPDDPAAPREVAGHEEQTRPVRPSQNLAAAAATALPGDEESRRPTGEVPSVGHELRAKAPDQRVHTSPIGNILPSEILETLDEAVAANSGRGSPFTGSSRDARRAAAPFAPAAPRSGSGPSHRQSGPSRLDRTPTAPTDPGRQKALRERQDDRRGDREARGDRSGRRVSPKLRRAGRSEFPALSPPVARDPDDELASGDDRDLPRRAPNAPQAIGAEPTHYIARQKRGTRLLGGLRTLIWGLLWLGLGGAVAFIVVVLYRRGQPVYPLPRIPAPFNQSGQSAPPTPPRRPPAPPTKPPAPRVAVPGPSATQARDLVVPIPAAGGRPAPPGPSLPMTALAPGPATPLPAPAAPLDPQPLDPQPLDPQQRAAAEQTMSNIEFVIAERVAQVRACYDRAVRSVGPEAPAGRIEVAITLSDEGQATRVITVGNTVGIPLLAGCLEQRIAEWHFPRPLGTARTFRLPFIFSPSPEQSGPRPRR